MAKLTRLLALLRGRIVRQSFTNLLALLAFVLLQFGATQWAQAQQPGADFDHTSTGFVLNAQHQNVRCETCHLKGVFKGTPKDCASCHGWNNPRATLSVMPTNHIPTGNATCETCHQANMAQFVDATRAFNHVAVRTLTCVNCHSSNNPHPNVRTNPADATHQAVMAQGLACDKCHTTIQFTGPKIPTNHIPTAAVACTACHTNADYAVMPTITAIHANAPSTSNNCQQCHSAANAAAYTMPTMVPPLVAPPNGHVAMNGQACEACHIAAGSNVQLPVVNGAKFSGSGFSHAGINDGCATCHGANAVPGFGISNIIQMPSTSGAGPTSHIPTTAACETCHKPAPSGVMPGNATATVPGTGFRLLKPLPAEIHANVTVCAACHEAGMSWVGVDQYTRTTTLNATISVSYIGFQTRPNSAGGGYSIADPAHQNGGDCAICHTTSNGFAATNLPTSHIPIAPNAACSTCHKTADYAVMPGLTDIHANAKAGLTCAQCHGDATTFPMVPAMVAPPSNHIDMGKLGCEACHVGAGSSIAATPVMDGARFSNSSFSHTGITSGCATCHGSGVTAGTFFGVTPKTMVGLAPAHITSSQVCETCHTTVPSVLIPLSGGTAPNTFIGGKYSHSGVRTGCVDCHGPSVAAGTFYGVTSLLLMPSTAAPSGHIPSSTTCENCHAAPPSLVSVTAAGTVPGGNLFLSLGAPTSSQIHSNVTGSCNSCHESGMTWLGMSSYPRSPTTLIANATYTGFQTRPDSVGANYSVQDAGHPPAPADCSQCHVGFSYFGTPAAPANHIPYLANTVCGACHVGGFTTAPTVTAIHANIQNTSGNCVQCHSAASAAQFAATTTLNPIVRPPSNHVPMGTASCETCHVGSGSSMQSTPVLDGAKFSGSAFSHMGMTATCATCHGPSGTTAAYAGITSVVAMPATSPAGDSSHLPTSTACETCHTGSVPSGLLSVTAAHPLPGSLFQNSPPNSATIHTGVTSCNSCHEAGMSWMGIGVYTRVPTAYTGNINTLYTGFQTRPVSGGTTTSVDDAGHPAAGECSQCHGNTTAFGTPIEPANHIPYVGGTACGLCHGNFSAVPKISAIHAYTQSTSTGCDQCHSPANAATYSAGMHNSIVTLPGNHISVGGLSCEGCHVGANSSIAATPVPDGAKFTGSLFNHASSTVSCATCHGSTVTSGTFAGVFPKTIGNLAPAHVPTTASCDTCHGAAPTGLVPGTGTGSFANAQFDHGGVTTGCVTCHGQNISNTSFYGISSIIAMPPFSGTTAHMPTSTTCENCHVGIVPSGLIAASSPRALGTSQFRNSPPTSTQIHSNAAGGCSACHQAGMSWVGVDLPVYAPNPSTFTGSGSLYKGFQTRPLATASGYSVGDPSHPPQNAGECSLCHGDTIAFGQPSVPTGHIPYVLNTACSDCHVSFGTAPTIGATHAKIQSTSTNCEQCHSTSNAALYAATTTLSPIKTPAGNHIAMGNLGCASCHVGGGSNISTTPVPDGSNFSNSAFLHDGTMITCGNCHGPNVKAGTFDGVTPKTVASVTHIPVSNNINCDTCHAGSVPSGLVPPTGYAGSPSFAGGQFIHTYITSGCVTCHGPTITSGSFKGVTGIVVMPSTSGANAHIPSSTTCENCHAGSIPAGLLSVSATHPASGTGFATSPPDSATIHTGLTGTCASCHEAGLSWVGMLPAYPRNFSAKQASPTTLYTGFHTRPGTAAGFSMLDGGHPATGDCSQCHGDFVAFGTPTPPANHIPFVNGANCTDCHAIWGTHPTITAIHAKLQSASTNCAQCHSDANATLYSSASRTIVRPGTNHVPMRGLGCESCHVGTGSSIATTPVTGTATFANSAFIHTGMTANCAECHGQSITGASFQGISSIVVMPPSTTPATTSHLPTSTTCESCHRSSMPTGLVPGNAPHAAPNSGFLAPAPTSTMIHDGVTGSCSSCHEKDMVWMSMSPYPITTAAPFRGFQTRPYATARTFSVADSVHPASGDCSSCHSGFVEWATNVKPANHIPTANVACSNCHTSTNYTTMPTIALIHANAPSTTTNCAQCHSAANALLYNTTAMTIKAPATNHIPMANLGCENCHVGTGTSLTTPVQNTAVFSNSAFSHVGVTATCATCHSAITASTFQGGLIPVTLTSPVLTPAHVPNPANLDCGVCHTVIPTGLSKIGSTSATFATGKFSHSGIATGCDACHGSGITGSSFKGITAIVVLPATTSGATGHIPSPVNAQCETCHLGSTPSTLVNASATVTTPGSTKFKSPTPTGDMIHTNVSGSCNSCHEAGLTWVDISLYPRSPSVVTTNGVYTGFHTRPNSPASVNSILDGSHPSGGDCSNCHGSTVNFSAVSKPTNHIPTSATAQCQNCHTDLVLVNGVYVSSSINFVQTMTLANIHTYAPSTTANCAQCHSTANAAAFAIPSISFSIKSPASIANHIPFGSTACEVCHVPTATPVASGTFAGGKFSHAGFTTGCATCHGAGISNTTFTGVTAIVAIPASTTVQGASTHIPYTAACEACHSATVPTGLVAVTTTGTKFATPVAAGPVIHTNSTGFACKACHERGYAWLGMAKYPRTPLALNLAVPTTAYNGFQTRPGAAATTYGYTDAGHTGSTLDTGDCALCHAGTTSFTGEGKPAGHIPTTIASCATCHITAGDYSVATLTTVATLHTGITAKLSTPPTAPSTSCVSCHSIASPGTLAFAGCTTQANCTVPPALNYYPKGVAGNPTTSPAGAVRHVPISSLDCVACHGSVTSFAGTTMGSTGHTNAENTGKIDCQSCHLDDRATQLNSTGGITTNYAANWTNTTPPRRNFSKHNGIANRSYPNDCNNSGCHSYSKGFRALQRPVPIMREALVSPNMGRIKPTTQIGKPSRGSLGNTFDHKNVAVGSCKDCHDGKSASGMPARHLMVATSCDTCHRPTTWLPAQFSHNGITANTCLTCHNGMGASSKPAGHFMTSRSCDSCHKNMTWSPVNYQHMSPLYRASPDKLTCISCHDTNGEIIRRQARALNRTKPIPVGP